ncbi:MAG: hypothetical protein KI792_12870 [Alphaproteobacteria bacterium]|nr:hypothetical protein [Alphaproteobacteria bacterium SS10]
MRQVMLCLIVGFFAAACTVVEGPPNTYTVTTGQPTLAPANQPPPPYFSGQAPNTGVASPEFQTPGLETAPSAPPSTVADTGYAPQTPPRYRYDGPAVPGYEYDRYGRPPQPSSLLACGITDGDFIFFSRRPRQYQPISFAVAPGETQRIQVTQDNNDRRENIFVQGDLSGVGVRISRNQPPEPGSNGLIFGASGGFASSEPQLVKGVRQKLNINDLFRDATISCGFRSPPGVLPGSRQIYRY